MAMENLQDQSEYFRFYGEGHLMIADFYFNDRVAPRHNYQFSISRRQSDGVQPKLFNSLDDCE